MEFGGFYFGFDGFGDFGELGRGWYNWLGKTGITVELAFWEFSCLEVVFWVCGFRVYFDFDCFGGIADLVVFGLLICGDFEFFGVNLGVCVVCARTLLGFAILGFSCRGEGWLFWFAPWFCLIVWFVCF